MVIKCGGKVVYVRSFKLRHQTLSSTESELSAMCESSTYAEWLQLLAREMFLVDPDAAIVYEQDNTAAIFMNEMGKGTFQRSKHMLVRSMFVDDLIKNGRIKLTHVPTGEMVADIGTKVMSDARMKELCALIHLRTIGGTTPATRTLEDLDLRRESRSDRRYRLQVVSCS
jgi:hypothetical protein